jgi:hypothetical protein
MDFDLPEIFLEGKLTGKSEIFGSFCFDRQQREDVLGEKEGIM